MTAAASVRAKYLGYPLLVKERDVTVFRPDGREIGLAYSMSGARRIVRGYRGSKR